MNERSTISSGISVSVGEVSPVYFSLNLRPPPRALSRVRYHQGSFLALQRSTTGGLPSIRSYRNYSGVNIFPTRQAPRPASGSASPPKARSRVRYYQGIFLALQRSTTGGFPSIRSYRNCSGGNIFPTRQDPRAVSGSASPPKARSRVQCHQGIFLAL